MSVVPNYFERQFMQQLRGRGWVKAIELPPARATIQALLQKRWIESEGAATSLAFKLTEEGLTAKKARIPIPNNRCPNHYGRLKAVQADEGVRLHNAG
jgi:hypothetical protein